MLINTLISKSSLINEYINPKKPVYLPLFSLMEHKNSLKNENIKKCLAYINQILRNDINPQFNKRSIVSTERVNAIQLGKRKLRQILCYSCVTPLPKTVVYWRVLDWFDKKVFYFSIAQNIQTLFLLPSLRQWLIIIFTLLWCCLQELLHCIRWCCCL